MRKTCNQGSKGFTLVELIIVVSIVAILAGSLFLIINPAETLRKSRDAKRMEDLTTVSRAMAAALATGNITLPAATVSRNSITTPDLSVAANPTTAPSPGWVGGFSGSLGSYISHLPLDPRNGDYLSGTTGERFGYFAVVTPTGWKLGTFLESANNAKLASNDGGLANYNICTSMPSRNCVYELGTDLSLTLFVPAPLPPNPFQ